MMHWMPSAQVDAQTCHFFVAMWAMAQARDWKWRWAGAFAAVIGFAVFKEFVFDIIVEGDSFPSSSLDAAFYMIGMFAGYWLQRLTGAWKPAQ